MGFLDSEAILLCMRRILIFIYVAELLRMVVSAYMLVVVQQDMLAGDCNRVLFGGIFRPRFTGSTSVALGRNHDRAHPCACSGFSSLAAVVFLCILVYIYIYSTQSMSLE